MVRFLRDSTTKEEQQEQVEPKLSKDHSATDNPLSVDDPSIADLEDFCSSFLDFDSLSSWIEENPVTMDGVAVSAGGGIERLGDMGEFGPDPKKSDSVEVGVDGLLGEKCDEKMIGDGSKRLGDLGEFKSEKVDLDEENGNGSLRENSDEKIVGDGFKGFGDLGELKLEKVDLDEVNGNGLLRQKSDVKMVSDGFEKSGILGSSIEEEMGKVKLVELNDSGDNIVKETKIGVVIGSNGSEITSAEVDESSDSSDSESESSSSSSSSSLSSEDDDDEEDEKDEEKVKEKVVMEEGEIEDSDAEKMVAWSDDEGDEDGGVAKVGPIKSKNELKDLPLVPPVDVSLEPHHHTLPVGVISSVIGAQVIVEGIEQHSPLNEGTVFWITETRSPLGIVDEIFGPVKSPYYIIRYNSDNEVPEGIKQGTPISFVPEFAYHVLKDNLYKKGYDASGENDEELSDEYEFSDDEKEAEYRKLRKMKKRGIIDPKLGGNEQKERKNFKSRGGGSVQNRRFSRNHGEIAQNNQFSDNSHAPQGGNAQQNQQYASPQSTSSGHGNHPNPFGVGQSYNNAPVLVPPFPQMVPPHGFVPMPNAMGTNIMPPQQGMMFPNGMVLPNPSQNGFPFPFPFPQQFIPNQNLPPNFSAAPPFGQWPGPFGQNGPNQSFGMGIQSQQVPMPMNVNGQQCPPVAGINQGTNQGPNGPNQSFGFGNQSQQAAMPLNGNGQHNAPNNSNNKAPQEFNQGAYQGRGRGRGRGRGPHHRGRGRFGIGRGRH